jgi:hypothetical protein
MLNFKKGAYVPKSEKIFEQYVFNGENYTRANINIENIAAIFEAFIKAHQEPLFLILETPATSQQEAELRQRDEDAFHKNVYYLDDWQQDDCLAFLEKYGELVFNDGFITIGFGGHVSHHEILWGKYNVMTLYTSDEVWLDSLMAQHGIPEVEKLVTAWDTFSLQKGGISTLYEVEGMSFYDLIKILETKGLYYAETREE